MAGERLEAALHGEVARLGDVPARDLAELIIGLERALSAAAYVALGPRSRRAAGKGRHKAAVERASRLRLHGVRAGSVIVELALPDLTENHAEELAVPDDLAAQAFDRLASALNQADVEVDRDLAGAVALLCTRLGVGTRTDDVTITSSRASQPLRLDEAVRARMTRIAAAPLEQAADVVVGRLVEADFEKRTARLTSPTGERVDATFGAEHEDDIHAALRETTRLLGLVRYDAETGAARSIELHEVARPEELPFDDAAFWRSPPTPEVLLREQGVTSAPDLDAAAVQFLTAEERDAAARALAVLRA